MNQNYAAWISGNNLCSNNSERETTNEMLNITRKNDENSNVTIVIDVMSVQCDAITHTNRAENDEYKFCNRVGYFYKVT